MKITREFWPGDRYVYDFGLCSYKKGWAQFDTAQDARYFGTWANPTRLIIFSYCKGDTTLKEAKLIPLAPEPQHVVGQACHGPRVPALFCHARPLEIRSSHVAPAV